MSLAVFDSESQKWTPLAKGLCQWPTWSRDSRTIYYGRQAEPGVFRIHVNGGEAEKAFDLPASSMTGALGGWFAMDPDGMPIMLRDEGSDEIYRLTLKKE